MNRHVRALIAADSGTGQAARLSAADRAAAAWGVQLSGERCQVHVSSHDQDARAYALALGATCESGFEIGNQTADLVLIGPSVLDLMGDALAGRWAEALDATLLFDGLAVAPIDIGWLVTCDAGRGAREEFEIRGPVVLVLSPAAPRPPYVSHYRLRQAAKSQAAAISVGGGQPVWHPVTPRPRKAITPSQESAEARANAAFGIAGDLTASRDAKIIVGEPEESAEILLRYLAHHGFVERTFAAATLNPLVAQVPAEPSMALASSTTPGVVSATLRRGPTRGVADESRRARRPRRLANSLVFNTSTLLPSQQRRPRPIGAAVSPIRGPFRMTSAS